MDRTSPLGRAAQGLACGKDTGEWGPFRPWPPLTWGRPRGGRRGRAEPSLPSVDSGLSRASQGHRQPTRLVPVPEGWGSGLPSLVVAGDLVMLSWIPRVL